MDPRFLDHFQRPRNVGEAVAEVAYRVQGCSGAIAAASALSELARGQTLQAARGLDRDAVSAALGELPTLKRHGADLAADGLQAALDAALRATKETS